MKEVRENIYEGIDKSVRCDSREQLDVEFILLDRVWEGVTTVMFTANFRRNEILRIVQELGEKAYN